MKQISGYKSIINQIQHKSFLLLIFFFLLSAHSHAQATFVLSSSACAGSSAVLSANIGTNTALAYTWAVSPAGPLIANPAIAVTSISFPTAGTYTVGLGVLFTVGYGYTTNIITIVPGPTITVTQSSVNTCIASNFPLFSKPVNLTATGANSYTWLPSVPSSSGIATVRPQTSTCYTVLGNSSGCVGSTVICVNVLPQFSFAVSPASGVRCIPDSLKLSIVSIGTLAVGPSSAFSYSWTENLPGGTISSNLSPTVQVYPTSNSTYTAEVKDALQCVSLPVSVAVTVANCMGISSASADLEGISIYPNPAKDHLTLIRGEGSARLFYVTISDCLGQIVRTSESTDQQVELDVSTLPFGLYLLKAENEMGQKTFKFIKE
ncbi:MAG: T9SS type A sorting domain-containing protein [bacterium]|nr:T9SS type A sorting domain-containing protein [bacterium]